MSLIILTPIVHALSVAAAPMTRRAACFLIKRFIFKAQIGLLGGVMPLN
ncbi:hypothetical protein [Azospirillum sp. B4]|nr:hypothetical protein [Azospirillum sp. B4]